MNPPDSLGQFVLLCPSLSIVRAYFSVAQSETELLMLMRKILLTKIPLLMDKITREDLVSSTCDWMKYDMIIRKFSDTRLLNITA